jgi:hypothetical protein
MSDTLRVRRLSGETRYVVHFATTGYGIDLDCQGAPYTVLRRPDGQDKDHPGMKEYALTADLSAVPVSGEIALVMRGTYWNGAQSDTSSAVDTYTTDDIGELRQLELHVLLPDKKPAKNARVHWELSGKEGSGGDYAPAVDLKKTAGGRSLDWLISERIPNRHYQLDWSW